MTRIREEEELVSKEL